MIRESSNIQSVTITDVSKSGVASLGHAPFKQALFDTSYLVFYEYEGRYYYPYSLEFRLIDNNVLFLIEELGIQDTEQIKTLLTSSMIKEEKWSNEFKIALIRLSQEPRFMHRLSASFRIPHINQVVSV